MMQRVTDEQARYVEGGLVFPGSVPTSIDLAADLLDARAELAEIKASFASTVAGECAPDEKHCTCVPALRYEVAALKAKLAAVCEAGEAHPPLMVMLAVEILCNHVEPGWENSQSVVWAWIAEERAKRNALVSAREVK
jgi:hypothetical protein